MDIFKKNILCIYILSVFIYIKLYEYKYTYFLNIYCMCVYLNIVHKHILCKQKPLITINRLTALA